MAKFHQIIQLLLLGRTEHTGAALVNLCQSALILLVQQLFVLLQSLHIVLADAGLLVVDCDAEHLFVLVSLALLYLLHNRVSDVLFVDLLKTLLVVGLEIILAVELGQLFTDQFVHHLLSLLLAALRHVAHARHDLNVLSGNDTRAVGFLDRSILLAFALLQEPSVFDDPVLILVHDGRQSLH